MSYEVTDKLKDAVRTAFSFFPTVAATGVAAFMGLTSPAFAQQTAFPDVSQAAWSSSEFVYGVQDEASGRSTLAQGAIATTPREAGSEWQRINEMTPGEIRTLAGIVFHANSELRKINDHLRKQMQGTGVPFIEAEQTAWKVVLTGAMVGDQDPFEVSLEDSVRLSNEALGAAVSAYPVLSEALVDASRNADLLMFHTARGDVATFEPLKGVYVDQGIPADDIWYKADNLDQDQLRSLASMVADVSPPFADLLDEMVVKLTDEHMAPRAALALADSAILAGGLGSEIGEYFHIDTERASETAERLRLKVSEEYSPEIYHIVSEGIDRATQASEIELEPY